MKMDAVTILCSDTWKPQGQLLAETMLNALRLPAWSFIQVLFKNLASPVLLPAGRNKPAYIPDCKQVYFYCKGGLWKKIPVCLVHPSFTFLSPGRSVQKMGIWFISYSARPNGSVQNTWARDKRQIYRVRHFYATISPHNWLNGEKARERAHVLSRRQMLEASLGNTLRFSHSAFCLIVSPDNVRQMPGIRFQCCINSSFFRYVVTKGNLLLISIFANILKGNKLDTWCLCDTGKQFTDPLIQWYK